MSALCAKRRGVFGESLEGRPASYEQPLVCGGGLNVTLVRRDGEVDFHSAVVLPTGIHDKHDFDASRRGKKGLTFSRDKNNASYEP